MPFPICILDIYTGLKRALPLLPTSSIKAVSSLLQTAHPELLRLCFLALHRGHPVEIRDGSLYAPAERQEPADLDEDSDPAFWVVFEQPANHKAGLDFVATALPFGQVHAAQRDLAQVLEEFHFFASVTCTSELRRIDLHVARQIAALQGFRQHCGAELHGEQLTLHSPVGIFCSESGILRVSGLAPLDQPPSGHDRHLMAASKAGCASVVVLGEGSISLVPDPTVGLRRVN